MISKEVPPRTSRRRSMGFRWHWRIFTKVISSSSWKKRQKNIDIIEKWIKPGTTIISDFWKPYDILGNIGYEHLKVNHSIHFVNDDGDHTNKIEGHWRVAKASLPTFGVKKEYYSSYLASFMWKYQNKDKNMFTEFVKVISHVYIPNI